MMIQQIYAIIIKNAVSHVEICIFGYNSIYSFVIQSAKAPPNVVKTVPPILLSPPIYSPIITATGIIIGVRIRLSLPKRIE